MVNRRRIGAYENEERTMLKRNIILWSTLFMLAALVFSTGLQAGTAGPIVPDKASGFAPGEILVKFKGFQAPPTIGPSADQAMMQAIPASARAAIAQIQGKVTKVLPLLRVCKIEFAPSMPINKAIDALYASRAVAYAEPNYYVQLAGAPDDLSIEATPNDPNFTSQWGLNNTGQDGGTNDADIDAPEAWNVMKNSNNVVVAVIDSGVEYTHEDLLSNMWANPNETPGNGIDDDGNGYVDDVMGIDTYSNDANPLDEYGHGTGIAGVIGAVGNNGKGICGIGWNAKIMALRAYYYTGQISGGTIADVIECIQYALAIKQANNYPRMIINAALYTDAYSQALYDAIKACLDKKVLYVTASGNNAQDAEITPYYPGCYNLANIINVGASDRTDKRWYYSNWGASSVDLFAPGVDIYGPWKGNTYQNASGTSWACAFVSGAAAVVWQKYPTVNWMQVKARILNGAEDGVATPAPYFARLAMTEGRLNLNNSLKSALNNTPAIFAVKFYMAGDGEQFTVEGINFGATAGTLLWNTKAFPAANIVSWANDKIVAKMTIDMKPRGWGRLKVTSSLGKSSRGACFAHSSVERLEGNVIIPRGYMAHAQVGNYVWMLGGYTYWGTTGLVERYDLTTNTPVIDGAWNMPTPAYGCAGASIGTNIYVVGGYDGTNILDNLRIFNTTTGTWSAGKPCPIKIYAPAIAVSEGKLYVFGGVTDTSNNYAIKDTYRYDPASDTWTKRADMPNAVCFGAGTLFSVGPKMWVVGGAYYNGYGYERNYVQEYSPGPNIWAAKANLNQQRMGAVVGTVGAKVICAHGYSGGFSSNGEWFMTGWTTDIFGFQGLFSPAIGKVAGAPPRFFILTGRYANGDYYSTRVWSFASP